MTDSSGSLIAEADTQVGASAGYVMTRVVREKPTGEVLAAVGSSMRGLAGATAADRLRSAGRNELPHARRVSPVRRLLAQFTDLFAVVLLVAATLTALAYVLGHPSDVGHLQLTIAILAVVALNAVIGFLQEYMAERTADALRAMVPHRVRVIRDGERTEIAAAEVVPGDLTLLEAGDAVPGDCRVVEAHELTVNNMALTGESAPVRRSADPVAADLPLTEARNLVWMGTTVVSGTGRAVVVATGAATEFGRIFRLTTEATADRTPLQHQAAAMARRVALAAFTLGTLLFLIRLPAGDPLVATFVFALGVMVACVPEGLPATMSVSLAIGVRRMARRHALIKKLLAVETLGSTTVICTDKTGTLTKAEMTVQQIWTAFRTHRVSGAGYAPTGEVEDPEAVQELLRVAALCCDARLLPPTDHSGWRILGDTTEGALLVAAAKAGLDLDAERRSAPRVGEFPFDSTRKLMTTLHRRDDLGGRRVANVKGAPQELLARCTHIQTEHGRVAIDDDVRRQVLAANDDLARGALRVLAVAVREVGTERLDQDGAERDLTFLGLVGMLDPPRPEVVAAVGACRHAGIRIVMVTGDYALTAEAIARRVGILSADSAPRTVTGAELDGIDDAALKRADIGVSMGESGTDVAREASVMVLLDDSFASISAAVELGRSVYANIRKFLIYVFSSNVGELVPILAATFTGFPLVPISTLQILAIDLGSDVLPALALGAEPPEPGTMNTPPRRRTQPLFSASLVGRFLFLGGVQAAAATAVFFWTIQGAGIPFDQFTVDNPVYQKAITMTQAAIVVSQVFVGLAVRSDRQSIVHIGLWSNPWLLGAQGVGVLMICAISYLPPLRTVFHTAPLAPVDWLLLIALGSLVLVADELRKIWVRRTEVPT
jgi:magnesium-transporting ATPase (P-type)